MRILEIIGGVIIIMAIASPVTGWLYKVSPDGVFEKGTYQPIASLYLFVGFLVLIIINFKKYRKCEKEDIVRMILLFSLEMLAILLNTDMEKGNEIVKKSEEIFKEKSLSN